MKKHWTFLVGASLLTGLAGSILWKKNKQLPSPQELQHNYTGHWWFVEITSSFNVFIDGKQTHALLVELTPKRLVILDKLGYHLIIQCENGVPATLYDEADDETYTLERAIYN